MSGPYIGVSKVLGVTGYYKFHCKMKFFDSLMRAAFGPPSFFAWLAIFPPSWYSVEKTKREDPP